MSKSFLPYPTVHQCYPASKPLKLIESIINYNEYQSDNTFCFLNISKSYDHKINWNDISNGKLWLYHLCSFNYLGQKDISSEQGIKLIRSCINFKGIIDGLEPYPISLRLINTIKFLLKYEIKDSNIDRSLWWQASLLSRNIEFHLMGNHLLENGFALLFSGYYFDDLTIISKAKKILSVQLKEQILPDGAHFELSPMYHSTMLYRVLDAYNLIADNLQNNQLTNLLKDVASNMLCWLKNMSYANGSYPHFNDSTQGIAPTMNQLLNYAKRLQIEPAKLNLKESGYRAIDRKKNELRLDFGKMGPDYIPGHAHNDIFSFELQIDNKPFIVDTGISTYELGQIRTKERNTASHNTVQFQREEQADLWASFRVGKRNYPKILKEGKNFISGNYIFPFSKNKHYRKMSWDDDDVIVIKDKIESRHMAKAYLHFHPIISLNLKGNKITTLNSEIIISNAEKISIEYYNYAKGFNRTIASKVVVIEFKGEITTTISL